MASDGNDQDAEYALSKLLQMGTVEDYQRDPLTLGEDFFKARITEARFEIIAKEDKEHIVEKKIDAILSLQGEFASPKAKGSLDADEDNGVDDVSSAIDGVFNIGESNVESIEVRSKFGEFSENKASLEEVVVGGGKVLGVGEDDDLCNAATDEGDDMAARIILFDLTSSKNYVYLPTLRRKRNSGFAQKGGFVCAYDEGNVGTATTTTTNSNEC
ncbi:hypothetical protein Tco_0921132 [Tanacetum coccineum]